jgi:predicted phage-related endonuclease
MDNFNNYSNEQLADEIGKLDLTAKQVTERLDELKDAFKARNCSAARGDFFAVTVSESTSTRLDTIKLKADLGDALKPYEKETTSKRINIKASPRLAAVA